ncbi:MAG: 4Fe-4S binding protein [Candidatus Adiutrix sp.]|jgi:polyferredoxin|nr:4Fe-4S binding protein [Candidatus Adiutrix sp.]
MTIKRFRLVTQHLAFAVLTYGGHFKISLGSAIPCLSCPFIGSCGGGCYLMAFQRAMSWLFLPLFQLIDGAGSWEQVWQTFSYFLSGFGIFVIVVILFGKSWCGWLCPFGLLQDWMTRLRQALKLREAELSNRHKRVVSKLKYVLLAYLIAMPVMVSLGWLPRDFVLAFCNICPAKPLMPIFVGDFHHLGITANGDARSIFSILLMIITGGMVAGMFFKERFFCLLCPMMALINLLKPFYLLKVVKEPEACQGCGNCRRGCCMDNETSYRERIKPNVYDPDCSGCFNCAESCASDGSLAVKFGPFKIFSSSRRYAAKLFAKVKP